MTQEYCKECHTIFEKKREWHKFCSTACRTKDYLRTKNEDAALGRRMRELQKTVAPPEPAARKRDLFSNVAA
jgi:hypothetical protein